MNELDINNPQLPDFIVPGADEKKQDEPAKIKVIGVGGGGGNAVNHMYHQGIGGVSFVLCNTDAQALRNSPVPVKVQLGAKGEPETFRRSLRNWPKRVPPKSKPCSTIIHAWPLLRPEWAEEPEREPLPWLPVLLRRRVCLQWAS